MFTSLKERLGKKYNFLEPYIFSFENSSQSINEFPDWYKKYLEQTTGEKIQNLKVDVLNVSWHTNDSITVNSVYNLINE